jgi:hypothetical protein
MTGMWHIQPGQPQLLLSEHGSLIGQPEKLTQHRARRREFHRHGKQIQEPA